METELNIKKIFYLLVNSYPWFEVPDTDIASALWARVLEDFSQEAIEKAVVTWVSESSKEPTPADIKKLCIAQKPRRAQLEWNPPANTNPEKLTREETQEILKNSPIGKYLQ